VLKHQPDSFAMRVLVIGARASGLVTAKTLRERGHDVFIVTDSHTVGGTFENKAYKGAGWYPASS